MSEENKKRANIPVPDATHRGIKAQAAKRGLSIREYVEPVLKLLSQGIELQPKGGN